MGLRVLAIYAHSIGSLHSGALAALVGAPWAANVNAAMGIGLTGLLALMARKLRLA